MGTEKDHKIRTTKRQDSTGSFFAPALVQTKRMVNTPGDAHEREADRVAEQVVSKPAKGKTSSSPPSITPVGPQQVQREEKEKDAPKKESSSSDVLTEGLSLTYDHLLLNPGFKSWKEAQTERLKYKLWDSQPDSAKAGMISLGVAGLGMAGSAFALSPEFRDFMQDKNLALPLSLLPYSEYYGLSSFKYKFPTAEGSPYTFTTEFEFDAWLKLMSKKWGIPEMALSTQITSTYGGQAGFKPFSGGSVKLKIGGGIINLSAFINKGLPPVPMLISNPGAGEPPTWLMRSYPADLPGNLPKGTGVFLTVDVLRVPELFRSTPKPKPGPYRDEYQRKELPGTSPEGNTAPPVVNDYLRSSSGRPMEQTTQRDMERRFDQDFSKVRVHTGPAAARSAKAINAEAYTSGSNIVFGSGAFRPNTSRGQKLLAHELVHVGQQTGVVQRKENDTSTAAAVQQIRELLEEDRYSGAWLQLHDTLDWPTDTSIKKNWLLRYPDIRFLFLSKKPSGTLFGTYSAAELEQIPRIKGFRKLDCWYPTDQEKQSVYSSNMRLFDYYLEVISPYTGLNIVKTVEQLTESVKKKKKYTSDFSNPEFHTINLLAPSVERKIKFYKKYEKQELFKEIRKKFDPFTGLTLGTMERLTDTNEVGRQEALAIYKNLKQLPSEQRMAFLETALFAGSVESNKDAEKYYKKKYSKQYKALPYNWDFKFWFWNWGEAPFADRLTFDHVVAMSEALNFEDKATRDFGFDRGIDASKKKSIAHPAGKPMSDTERLLGQLKEDANFNNPQRLEILLAIAVRAGARMTDKITNDILRPKAQAEGIGPMISPLLEHYGFIATDHYTYHPDKAKVVDHDDSRLWYIISRTVPPFDWFTTPGSVAGEQRGTFDLRRIQKTSDHLGSLGGMKFGKTEYAGDSYYNTTWLDKAVSEHKGSSTLLPNLRATKGEDRRGKIFASIRNDIKQANIYATTLPIEGLNFFSGGTLYRSGAGVIQGLAVHLSWTKDTSKSDNSIYLRFDIDNLLLNQFQLIAPQSTMAIGHIGVKGLRVILRQKELKKAGGLFLGLLKNADFTLDALMKLLPNVLKLLPYAIMAMTEEFKGPQSKVYKEALGEVVKNDFSGMKTSLTFTSVTVKDIYDTTAGFLDNITIAKQNKEGKLVRQGFAIKETPLWYLNAWSNIRERIASVDQQLLKMKAELAGTDYADRIKLLEQEKSKVLKVSSEKALRYEDRSKERERLRAIMKELRELNKKIEEDFKKAKQDNPLYNQLAFDVIQAEKKQLEVDLDYADNGYFDDLKTLEGNDKIKRYEAQKRIDEFIAKHKSVDVYVRLRGINLQGGNYVRDLINNSLKSVGFKDPEFEGIENVKIDAIQSSFTASGLGAAQLGKYKGAIISNLHLPMVKASSLLFDTGKLLIEAGKPKLENTFVSVSVDFVKNPLDRDPKQPYKYVLSKLYVRKATFNGLKLKTGEAEPLLDFPAKVPVEVWGLKLWDYDPEKGNINLRIRDIKAEGTYADKDEEKKTSERIDFGIDTTLDNDTKEGRRSAFELRYKKQEDSIITKLNIASAWIPALDLQSEKYSITSEEGTQAVKLSKVQAEVKVLFAKDAVGDQAARPTVIEIRKLSLDKISAQGIRFLMMEPEPETEGATAKKKKKRTVQEVRLPKEDSVEINDIEVSGLRITLTEEGPKFSTLENDAEIKLGVTELDKLRYSEKTTSGKVLQSLTLHRGRFQALTLRAIERNGREYTLREFLKFFGYSRLEGLDASGSYRKGKTSGTISVKGDKNKPISVDYVEAIEGKKAFYRVRLPLEKVSVPALQFEKDGHEVKIPRATSSSQTSALHDVDVQMRVYHEFNDAGEAIYDVYLDKLQIADMKVFGLEYHNRDKGIDLFFDKQKPLHIPHVKAGGFRLSSQRGFGVFGKAGGWIEAAEGNDEVISSHFEKIAAGLKNGSFLVENTVAAGGDFLGFDINSLGIKYDQEGNLQVILGAIKGGFPKMTIKTTDPATGAKTTTVVTSIDRTSIQAEGATITIKADKTKNFDVRGIEAGGLKVTHTEELGGKKSVSTLKLGKEAVGAASTNVTFKPDGSKEIIITDIKAGRINLDLVSTSGKGKSEAYIQLPDPESIQLEAIIINIDDKGHKDIKFKKPIVKNIQLRVPNQKIAGDYTSIVCDIKVDGDVVVGEGSFATMLLEDPFDAWVGRVDNAAVKITNLRLEHKDTSKPPPSKMEAPKDYTVEQEKLLELEEKKDKAEKELYMTPRTILSGDGINTERNPEYDKVEAAFNRANLNYGIHKGKMIGVAKAEAQASMSKKYLDAISGDAKGKLQIFGSTFPLNIETHTDGEKYVEIPSGFAANMKSLLQSLLKKTFHMSFWSSEEMKALGKGLQRWYVWVSPTAKADVDSIAKGNAYGVISLLLRDIDISVGKLEEDASMFGVNLNLEGYWALDATSYDEIGIGLCEMAYQHKGIGKSNYYNLYGFVEYLQFVNKSLVSNSGKLDRERAEALRKGLRKTEEQASDLDIGDAVKELVAFIKFSLAQELDYLKTEVLRNIKLVELTADVTLRPEEVINAILKEKKAGQIDLDKGKKSIDDVHVDGAYSNSPRPNAKVTFGGGSKGENPIVVPGLTWWSEKDKTKGTKVSYDELTIKPATLSYEKDTYKLKSDEIDIKGLAFGVKKKK